MVEVSFRPTHPVYPLTTGFHKQTNTYTHTLTHVLTRTLAYKRTCTLWGVRRRRYTVVLLCPYKPGRTQEIETAKCAHTHYMGRTYVRQCNGIYGTDGSYTVAAACPRLESIMYSRYDCVRAVDAPARPPRHRRGACSLRALQTGSHTYYRDVQTTINNRRPTGVSFARGGRGRDNGFEIRHGMVHHDSKSWRTYVV